MRKIILSLVLGSALFSAGQAAAGPVTGPQAKAHIQSRLQYSSRVVDKTRPFTTRLGGKKGDPVRPFVASNLRMGMPLPGPGVSPRSGRFKLVGNRVEGELNMQTGQVRTVLVTPARELAGPAPR